MPAYYYLFAAPAAVFEAVLIVWFVRTFIDRKSSKPFGNPVFLFPLPPIFPSFFKTSFVGIFPAAVISMYFFETEKEAIGAIFLGLGTTISSYIFYKDFTKRPDANENDIKAVVSVSIVLFGMLLVAGLAESKL